MIEGQVYIIKPDPTRRNWFYSVMQNPFKDYHDTRVIYGSSYEIVERKLNRQYTKFKIENIKFKGEIINE